MMPVVAVGLAFLCIYILFNSRVRARGFERGRVRVTKVQPWSSSGDSTVTMSRTYKVHGVVRTGEGSFSATSVDLYDEGVLRKEGQELPCRYDPADPSRMTLTMSDPDGIGVQDVVLVLLAAGLLVVAWFTR